MTQQVKQSMIGMTMLGLGLCLTGCPKQGPEPGTPTDRPELSRAECQAKGGEIVGDIGDGAIHKPDYVCPSGERPTGTIKPAPGEPIAIEGEVCCPP